MHFVFELFRRSGQDPNLGEAVVHLVSMPGMAVTDAW
jgi:hypothetical protein